jgi:hypothetical protein
MKLVINGADVELDGRYAKTLLPQVLRDVAALHSEEVVKRDPGLRRAHRSSRTSLIPSASLVIEENRHVLHPRPPGRRGPAPVAVAMAGSTPPPTGDAAARPSANGRQPSSAFFGGRRSVK